NTSDKVLFIILNSISTIFNQLELSRNTTVETSLEAFSAVVRACGDICREPCKSDGYGTDMVRCDDCCTEDFCNGNYSVRYYLELMKQQYTSWIKPLVGEKLYNRNNNITFPY
uniref:Toxin_TOLIP domain-containing protein n=1 Tax=Elaeophora elaphi TaxID=1147741 RepID=A0A0R3S110_9BILA